jgi:anti-anti-sigma factor
VRCVDLGVEYTADTTIVTISGEVDLSNEDEFVRALATHLNDGADTVVLDLSEVRYLSLTGYRLLAGAVAQAGRRAVTVRVLASLAVRRIASAAFGVDAPRARSTIAGTAARR